jgi:aryl-alcohol dehydrogenase-like predicted oxidoreductase
MTMTYRQLGDSGLTVSAVGVGCNAFGARIDQERASEVVEAALDEGITLFDTADTYGREAGRSEEFLGTALGTHRADVIVATKFGMDTRGANGPDWGVRGSRRYIRKAVEASLRRLGTDWIDLYQMHEPDPSTPIEETLSALHELVLDGVVRYIGSSNFAGWQVTDADWVARTAGLTRFVGAQNHYSLLSREVEKELVPACEHLGVGLLPFFPLEYGLLTGKYRRNDGPPAGSRLEAQRSRYDDADFDHIESLEAFAADRGITLLELAVGGLAAQPAVGSVIAGATRGDQVRANAAAAAWQPTDDDLAELDALNADFG